jgi:hypothetical protein
MFRLYIKIIFWLIDIYCEQVGHQWIPNRYPLFCSRCGISITKDGVGFTYYGHMHRSAMIMQLSWVKRPICKLFKHKYNRRDRGWICQRCGKKTGY